MNLQYKITIYFSIVLIIVIGFISVFIFGHLSSSLETQMGNNAMDVAVTVASIDKIQEVLFNKGDNSEVQRIIESFRSSTRFQYVIVIDMEAVQYSYPYEIGLGKYYKNGGEKRVLENGESYISTDENVLISAVRAFAPVYYDDKQVGAVIVGLLTEKVNEENITNRKGLELTLVLGLLAGMIGAGVLSYNIKKSILGLEPKEIALLLIERDTILQNLTHGIIAVDSTGHIIMCNDNAKSRLGFDETDKGELITDINKALGNDIMKVLETEVESYNNQLRISPVNKLVCNYTLMKNQNREVIGVLASFEDLTDAKLMAEELVGYSNLIDELRAQNHEFNNKLHTISGLIQLEEYKTVLNYISDLQYSNIQISNLIRDKIKNNHVAAILIGKYHKAQEAKISLNIDKDSYLSEDIGSIDNDDLCSVIGNLLDNAIEELIGKEDGIIEIYILSSEDDIEIVVEDNGRGISEVIFDKVYDRGVSTKKGNRGTGLYIVKEIVDIYNGSIDFKQDEGTQCVISIPFDLKK